MLQCDDLKCAMNRDEKKIFIEKMENEEQRKSVKKINNFSAISFFALENILFNL